jgi:hypothetical protein
MIPRSDFTGEAVDLHQVRRRAHVTDHALIRYLERVVGVPVEQIRAAMLTDTVLQAMSLNATAVQGDGFKLVIDNFAIVTTLPGQAVAAVTWGRRREIER